MREGEEQVKSIESQSIDIEKRERELNEIIPILAHGLVRRLERKGLSGKVRIRAVAGSDWGVAVSPENPAKDIPDVIVYPREYLLKDKKLVNARLRHEIGNLNYPIEEGLSDLQVWCREHGIAPALLTSLLQAIHEASVNYLEIRNAYSAHPEENFKALYEKEVDTATMAKQIKEDLPYKQVVVLTLLYSLSRIGIIPREHFEQGLANAYAEVREIFNTQTISIIDQAIRMASSKQQARLIIEYLWPKFSKFAVSTDMFETKVKEKQQNYPNRAEEEEIQSSNLSELGNIDQRIEEMREKLRNMNKQPRERGEKRSIQEQRIKQQPKLPSQELSPAEKKEYKQALDLLKKAIRDNLQNIQEQVQEAQEQIGKESFSKVSKPQTIEEFSEQAKHLQKQLDSLQQEARQDQELQNKFKALGEEIKQIEDIAEYISKPEEEFAFDEEPMKYNIKEYGIDESKLTEEQKEILEKIRHFARETSKVYRRVMRLLMQAYKHKNPNFTDKLISRIMEKGYDLPDFSLYGDVAAAEFLQSNPELGIDELSEGSFLVNFNLPKPFGRFWYKGGQGSKSIPVKEGEIEWGDFYRRSMPVIWRAVDRAMMQGLYLHRLNEFGQHDYKKYYYLWEAIGVEFPKLMQENQEKIQENEGDKESDGEVGGSDEYRDQGEDTEEGMIGEGAEGFEELGEVDEEQADAEGGGSDEYRDQGEDTEEGMIGEGAEGFEELGEVDEEQADGEGGGSDEYRDQSEDTGGGMIGEGAEGFEELGEVGEEQADGEGGELGEAGTTGCTKGTGKQRGDESGEGMPSTQEIQELLSQMQQNLGQAIEQGGMQGGQEAMEQMMMELQEMQEALESGVNPQDMPRQFLDKWKEFSAMMEGIEQGDQGELGESGESMLSEKDGSVGESEKSDQSRIEQSDMQSTEEASGMNSTQDGLEGDGFDKTGAQSEGIEGHKSMGSSERESSHDKWKEGGESNVREIKELFIRSNPELLKELVQFERSIESKFEDRDEDGNLVLKEVDEVTRIYIEEHILSHKQTEQKEQLATLELLKQQQQKRLEQVYREMSGLEGEALRVYIEYMEDMRDFIEDLKDFFIKRFKLDRDYLYTKHQRRGARLERGWQRNIAGIKDKKPVLHPESFERKFPPKKPQFAWTLIIDNSGSCSGEIIEQEKRLAVALIEVAKQLSIPFEIVTFGGSKENYTFLKNFEQDVKGDDLQKIVLLNADKGTPDVPTLEAACESMRRFTDRFKRSYNFVFFMTDGQSGSGSIQEVIEKYKRDMVITGVGLADASKTIKNTWGDNALEVPDVRKLSEKFIRKIEELIEQTFD